MGNVVQTCLSFGGPNAFSTVANACELNKRVLYAEDGRGRVVGRKLLAVSEDWRLVGFHTYSTLDGDGLSELNAIVDGYITEFAASCRIEPADSGEVALLFAENWYDDGVVEWHISSSAPGPTEPQQPLPVAVA